MKKEISRSLRKNDLLIFLIIITIYVFLYIIPVSNSHGLEAVIFYQNKKIVKSLLKDNTFKLGNAVIEIKDGKISIKENDCPGQQCVHMGKISETGQFILCDHYKILVRITGDKGRFDAISY